MFICAQCAEKAQTTQFCKEAKLIKGAYMDTGRKIKAPKWYVNDHHVTIKINTKSGVNCPQGKLKNVKEGLLQTGAVFRGIGKLLKN